MAGMAVKPGRMAQWRGFRVVVAFCLSAVACASTVAAQDGNRASDGDTARAIHLLSRATWGVRSTDIGPVLELGLDEWVAHQLALESEVNAGVASRLDRFPLAVAPVEQLIRDYSPPRPVPMDSSQDRSSMTPAERRERALRSPQRILVDLVGAKLTRAVHADRQVEEVMTDFWFNHFNIFFNKGLDRFLIGDYERVAIRPYVFGRFEDMLRATARHPAMLFYLDNATNFAPDSMATRRAGAVRQGRRERGINENYARELLELHTLGVDGGYTQQDVIAVARAFTGWTINGNRARMASMSGAESVAPTFVFRPMLHDAGAKTVLGHELPAGGAMDDGLAVLRILAEHPNTARHIARKLVERFVSDAGDAVLEDTLAAVFQRSGGDLREVTRTLFTSARFYAPEHRFAKVKTPLELVASTLRVTGAEIGPSPDLIRTLRAMGQLPYSESAPTGYPAASAEWVSTSAMLARMNFALDLSAGRVRGVRVERSHLSAGLTGEAALRALIERSLPGANAAEIEARVREDLSASTDQDRQAIAMRAVGLVLGSPEFQRR